MASKKQVQTGRQIGAFGWRWIGRSAASKSRIRWNGSVIIMISLILFWFLFDFPETPHILRISFALRPEFQVEPLRSFASLNKSSVGVPRKDLGVLWSDFPIETVRLKFSMCVSFLLQKQFFSDQLCKAMASEKSVSHRSLHAERISLSVQLELHHLFLSCRKENPLWNHTDLLFTNCLLKQQFFRRPHLTIRRPD